MDKRSSFGFVYLVKERDLPVHKIGITQNLSRRMQQLGDPQVIGFVKTAFYRDIERSLHRRFRDKRCPQSEWFKLNDVEVQQVLKLFSDLEIKLPPPPPRKPRPYRMVPQRSGPRTPLPYRLCFR